MLTKVETTSNSGIYIPVLVLSERPSTQQEELALLWKEENVNSRFCAKAEAELIAKPRF